MHVLLVDDDARLVELLATYLTPNGVRLTLAEDGPRGLAALEAAAFDAVLLDVMMPGMSGLEVCKRIRERSAVPIIMLTAKGDETDRVVGLELGADDYLTKPFSPRELLARLRAVVRRSSQVLGETLQVGTVTLHVPGRQVLVDNRTIEMTGLEFDILLALARRAGRVVSRDMLLQEAGRGDTVVGDRTVDVHISRLRQKLGETLIKTVRGVGYMLVRP